MLVLIPVAVITGVLVEKDPLGKIPFEEKGFITGRIDSKKRRQKGFVFYMAKASYSKNGETLKKDITDILIYSDEEFPNEQFHIGDKVKIQGKLLRPERARNPGEFDDFKYMRGEGLNYKFFARDGWRECTAPGSLQGIIWRLKDAAFRLKEKIRIGPLSYGDDRGVLYAVLLGDKSCLEDTEKNLFTWAGIGHILAISGLHISFIGLIVYQILRKCGVSFVGSGIISLMFLGFYFLMIGRSISILRAVIMLLIRIGSDICGRPYDALTSLFVAGFVVSVLIPGAILSAGFMLSFGSVFIIVYLADPLSRMTENRVFKSFLGSFAISAGLMPVSRHFFYEVPVYAPFVNVLVLPLMPFVMGLSILGILIFPVSSGLSKRLFEGAVGILNVIHKVADVSLRLPYARICPGKMTLFQGVVYAGLIILLRKFALQKKHTGWVALTMLLMFAVGIMPQMHGRDVEVTMIDVGQGDGIFIRGPEGKTFLIDGGSTDKAELGKYTLEPFFKSKGEAVIDYALISHGDSDHFSGVLEILEDPDTILDIKNIVFTKAFEEDEGLIKVFDAAKRKGICVYRIEPGDVIRDGEMTVTCLAPENPTGWAPNEKSMVLSLRYRDFSMLFTGDLEKRGEEELLEVLRDMENPKYQVLKVAHHGSRNSTNLEALDLVNPKIALISAGRNSAHGHPHKETLNKFQKRKIPVYETPSFAAISIKTDGREIKIRTKW